ncbi:MAG: hypothetical protein LBC87_09315 [Fibromonadaceae bacterium]|jgi:hypothetical protein|nr:hypothetical protein [Fibromonadaceae bacterium]
MSTAFALLMHLKKLLPEYGYDVVEINASKAYRLSFAISRYAKCGLCL